MEPMADMVGGALCHRAEVEHEDLPKSERLVDEHVALEDDVGQILAVVVGGGSRS